MYVTSNTSTARMKIPIVKYKGWKQGWICIKFWYISVGLNPLILYKDKNETIGEFKEPQSEYEWRAVAEDVHITNSNHIIFEANFRAGYGSLGLDDLSISMNECNGKMNKEKHNNSYVLNQL